MGRILRGPLVRGISRAGEIAVLVIVVGVTVAVVAVVILLLFVANITYSLCIYLSIAYLSVFLDRV